MVDQEAYDTLVKAHGTALSLLVTMLGRTAAIKPREFGSMLGLLATVTAEDCQEEGLILGAWAAMIEDLNFPDSTPEEVRRHN